MSKKVVSSNFTNGNFFSKALSESVLTPFLIFKLKLPKILAVTFLILGFLTGQKTKHQPIQYISKPLVIQTVKDSPPYIALREAMMDEESIVEKQGWYSVQGKAAQRLEALKVQAPAPEETVSKIQIAKSNDSNDLGAPTKILVRAKEDIMTFAVSPEEQAHHDENWQQELSRSQQLRLNIANDRHQLLEKEWNQPSFRELAEKAIAQADQQTTNDADKKVIVYNPQNPSQRGPDQARVEVQETKQNRSVVVGNIKLEAGAMLGPGDSIEIRKFEEGIPKEVGTVNLLESVYRIEVGNNVGVIAAHLLNKDGKIVAKGTYRLSSEKNIGAKADATIVLKPIDKHVSGVFYSADSFGDKKPASLMGLNIENTNEKTKTDKNGTFEIEHLAAGSTILARAGGLSWAKINALVSVGRDYKLPALPTKMLTSLKGILREFQNQSSMFENNSMIWGRAVNGGRPQRGLKVEVEGYPDIKPVYLNALYIPDPKLETTTDNGLFVFENVPEGFQSLLVTKFDAYFAHQNVVIERDTVSVTEVETTPQSEAIDIKVFDALTGAPESAQVAFQSYPEELEITGYLRIEVPYVHQTSLAFVKPEEPFEPMLLTYQDKADYIHVPLIRTEWLNAIRTSQRVDDSSETGTVLGFVNDENFEVYLSRAEGSENAHVVFFDSSGSPTPGNKGVAGGGFIVFNVDVGSQSVVVIGQESNQVFTQVVPVDANKLTVMGAILKD